MFQSLCDADIRITKIRVFPYNRDSNTLLQRLDMFDEAAPVFEVVMFLSKVELAQDVITETLFIEDDRHFVYRWHIMI
ncbi:hypothetical protein BMS3Bbin16_00499 [archaeon BMS3Bbin16]|nr:hypothetical protein BMS3Bbin16_00499 [archaeon BMS3Bbin16]